MAFTRREIITKGALVALGIGALSDAAHGDDPQTQVRSYTIPPGVHWSIQDSAVAYAQLELTDNVINIKPGLTDVEITIVNLILHGKNTFDLASLVRTPLPPNTPPGKGQAPNNGNVPRGGDGGSSGEGGGNGANGVNLKLSIQQLTASDGSMWIKTDGCPGGQGGDGGAGGKGSSGPRNGFHNPDGGSGGPGGRGGKGGPGGNTAKVSLKIGPNTISPSQSTGFAPSNCPAAADVPGTIVIQGAPGTGGIGGNGGPGGDGGEGYRGSGPLTHDSNSGAHGGQGPRGASGDPGNFIA